MMWQDPLGGSDDDVVDELKADWPSAEDIKKANYKITASPETSPRSVAVSLETIPSKFTLSHTPHTRAPENFATPGTHRRALLIVILITIVWPFTQVAAIYDESSKPRAGPPIVPRQHVFRPPPAWTWPATVPRNVPAALKSLGRLAGTVRTALGLSSGGSWIASLTLSNHAAAAAMWQEPVAGKSFNHSGTISTKSTEKKGPRLRVGPALLENLEIPFGLLG
jgi:hypothetical protein